MGIIWQDTKRFWGMPITFTHYRIENSRLYLKRGLLSTTEDELLLYRILDITVRQSLGDKLLNVGTVTVHSADVSHEKLELQNVKNPLKLRTLLSELVEQERVKARVQGREMYGVAENGLPPDLDGDGFPG